LNFLGKLIYCKDTKTRAVYLELKPVTDYSVV